VKRAAAVLLLALVACREPEPAAAPPAGPDDAAVADAYVYLLGRVLVLRQQRIDFEQRGFAWNRIVGTDPAEAWIAVDDQTCVELDVPEGKPGRYSTWQMLDGWGETVVNVNARTFPEHAHGRFALCLFGRAAPVPEGATRVDLVSRTARAIGRGAKFELRALGEPKVAAPVPVPIFANDALPKSELFERAAEILASEPDPNEGMEAVRAQVAEVEAFAKGGPANRERLDRAIVAQAWPALDELQRHPGPSGNGWTRPRAQGHYGADFAARTLANLIGPGLNTASELTPYGVADLDGGMFYLLAFPEGTLPSSPWTLSLDGKVVLDDRAPLGREKDGTLLVAFAPKLPPDVPKSNWIATAEGARYALTLRFFAPPKEIAAGAYFPPELVPQPRF
jgi:hypothetical protein